jgi:hypothetical protein
MDALAVGSSADSGHQLLHDSTEILDIFGADFPIETLIRLRTSSSLRAGAKPLENLQLGFFLFGQLVLFRLF